MDDHAATLRQRAATALVNSGRTGNGDRPILKVLPNPWSVHARALAAGAVLLVSVPLFAQDAVPRPAIWHDRGDLSLLDLAGGPRGTTREPGIEFTFVEESLSGTSPKFVVHDEYGTTWQVKLGEETRPETAATRLLWAAGYVVDEDYYRPRIHVRGIVRLARGQLFVSDGDVANGARLERHTAHANANTWDWYHNPFVGTREFNGLRVMMALVNNWDLKAVNNDATETPGGGREYGS